MIAMGTLYLEHEWPIDSTTVLIVVDSVNTPTGVWEGKIIEASDDAKNVSPTIERHTPGTRWTHCKAQITDPRAPKAYQGREPHLNYSVYMPNLGMKYLMGQLVEAKAETKGLKHRLEIERSVFHGALKAMVSSDSFAKLEKLLSDFIRNFAKPTHA